MNGLFASSGCGGIYHVAVSAFGEPLEGLLCPGTFLNESFDYHISHLNSLNNLPANRARGSGKNRGSQCEES